MWNKSTRSIAKRKGTAAWVYIFFLAMDNVPTDVVQ
jgi:hypothetical protein